MVNLSNLNREGLMQYFGQANNLLVEAEKLTDTYNNLNSQIKNTVESREKIKDRISRSYRFADDLANQTGRSHTTGKDSFIENIMFRFGVMGFDLLFGWVFDLKLKSIGKWFLKSMVRLFIADIFLSIFMPNSMSGFLYAFLLCFVVIPAIESKINKKKMIKKMNEEIVINNKYLAEQAEIVDSKIIALRDKWNRNFPEFPKKYEYSYATSYFYDALEGYRADNIKELINSYEEHLYRERMINSQNEIIQEKRKSNIIAQQNYYANLAQLHTLRND